MSILVSIVPREVKRAVRKRACQMGRTVLGQASICTMIGIDEIARRAGYDGAVVYLHNQIGYTEEEARKILGYWFDANVQDPCCAAEAA